MLGAAAVQDTATLVRGGARKLIDAVAAVDKEAAKGLAPLGSPDFALITRARA